LYYRDARSYATVNTFSTNWNKKNSAFQMIYFLVPISPSLHLQKQGCVQYTRWWLKALQIKINNNKLEETK
jgi:hypothetical protein